MYWTFRSKMVAWNDEDVYAEIIKDPYPPLHKPDWWGNEPIPEPKPEFHFSINPKAPMLDNYSTGTIYYIFSKKLIDVLSEMGVNFEIFPTLLFQKGKKKELNIDYKVVRLLEMSDALDSDLSDYVYTSYLGKEYPQLDKIVLKTSFIKENIPMTRLQSDLDLVIINDDLKKELERKQISGCRYQKVDDYRYPTLENYMK